MSGAEGTGSSLTASSRRRELAAEAGRKGRGPFSGMPVRENANMPLRLESEAFSPAAALSRFSASPAVKVSEAVAPLPEARAVRIS